MDPDLEFSARLPARGAKAVLGAGGAILILVVGIGLLADDDGDRRTSVVPSSTTAADAATARPTSVPPEAGGTVPPSGAIAGPPELDWRPGPDRPIEPGAYYVALDTARVRLLMPAGWVATDRGTTLRNARDTATLHLVTDPFNMRVSTDVCPLGEDATFATTGLLPSDLVHDLASQAGIVGSDPVDVVMGTFPATRIDRTDLLCRGGLEGRWIWREGDRQQCPARRVLPCASGAEGFGLLFGGTATIYVVDVNTQRLVIATNERGASPDELSEVDAIIASIDIDTADPIGPSTGYSPLGRRPLAADGMPISFVVPMPGWEYHDRLSLTRPLEGVNGQGAEAVVYWTQVPDGGLSDLCTRLVGPDMGTTLAGVADAVATSPGTELLSGPLEVSLAGRPARSVRIRVVNVDRSCDPGFFYTWPCVSWGAWWPSTAVGDVIRVWLVDVAGSLLIIAGETRWHAGFGDALTEAQRAGLDREIEAIVASATFD